MIAMNNLENLATEIGKDIKDIKTRYATKEEMHEATEIDYSRIVTHEELEEKHYLTEHQNISHLATKAEVITKLDKIDFDLFKRDVVTHNDLAGRNYLTEHQSPTDGVPNPFGVLFDGLLTIDRKTKTVSLKKDTWISFGNKNYAPNDNLSISYEPTGLSEYVVYDFQNKGLTVMTLANVKNITSTQVILAIMYKSTLHYPVNSMFVKTIGYSEYAQDSLIGSVVQGKIIYDNYSKTFSFIGFGEQNEIIVSKGTSYYSIKEHENLQLTSGFLHHLILDTIENKFKLVKSSVMSSGATFTSKNTDILIASIYLGELTHYSNNNFIETTR